MITGLFNIRITVDYQDNLYQLVTFAASEKDTYLLITTQPEGKPRDKYIISVFFDGIDKEVLTKAKKIVQQLRKLSINVTHIQIASKIDNQGVPVTDTALEEYIQKRRNKEGVYFQFQIYIDSLHKCIKQVKLPATKVSYAVNITTDVPQHLLVARVYNNGCDSALRIKKIIIEYYQQNNVKVRAVEQSFNIYVGTECPHGPSRQAT